MFGGADDGLGQVAVFEFLPVPRSFDDQPIGLWPAARFRRIGSVIGVLADRSEPLSKHIPVRIQDRQKDRGLLDKGNRERKPQGVTGRGPRGSCFHESLDIDFGRLIGADGMGKGQQKDRSQ